MAIQKQLFLGFVLLFLNLSSGFAQQIKGTVFDLETSQRIGGITVLNIRTQEKVETDIEGKFEIDGKLDDYIQFSGAGFEVDTAFIYGEGERRFFLVRDEGTIVINEVFVSRLTDSRLAAEIRKAEAQGKAVDASQHKGGLRISPSRLFGSKGKQARSNLKLLLQEQENREVDKVFSNSLIRSVIANISQQDFTSFRSMYRPSLEFIKQSSEEDLRVYIIDSYKKFKENKTTQTVDTVDTDE